MITAQKYYYNGSLFLFSCSDGKVRDDDGYEWVKEWYRGNIYFRKKKCNIRISLKTINKSSCSCMVII